jgi:ABC-2 type transport system ATP-binding protein
MSGPTPKAPATPAIEVAGVGHSFGGREALRDISFSAGAGELLAVIGPNGAGKTTLLSILAGIRDPDSGEVTIPGKVGWVPQQAALYRRLTVEENLRLFARLEQCEDIDGAVDRMLDQTGLRERRADQIGTLSGGNQQRVNIAIGLLSQPAVLLLDEPSTGLDPRQRERLWEFVMRYARAGTTVIYTTHHISEVELYATRVLVLADAEDVFDGSVDDLLSAVPDSGSRNLEAAFVALLRERGH